MDFTPSPRTEQYLDAVRRFMTQHIDPVEPRFWAEVRAANPDGDWRKWTIHPLVEELKARARSEGLWNLFLPDSELGAGLSTLEYAPVAEQMGRSFLAPEVFNCAAPDTGNMEVLWRYGSAEQRERWLAPLLAGEIRSVFCMTEPDTASSDATNLRATAVVDGDEIVLNGTKWWSSGIGDPRARVAIFMARTPDEAADRHHLHSMVLVPLDAPGVEIRRMLPVFGSYDAPHGHGEVSFTDVRLPLSAVVGAPGMGFEIAQGRLGPGRIHHCMRCIGAAERALELMVDRGMSRTAFGKPLMSLGGNRERLADARIAIDQARLLTLYAAWKLDAVGAMAAMTEISAIKVAAPNVLQRVVDDAMQIHGGAGMSDDTPLAGFFAQARSLRLADGPDEVHKGVIARIELAKRGFGGRRS
ncbi:acyl-CoA dehydrogenase family protein [Longimicrobium terrae]|uniref:Alkylation response protein AidB-like acyl-CoA dehydrogenase n=1 Tax=Longimicrobium terrae TaxID=1639882 RepID=A0A841H4K7_9BACT|nr:acyl-CoA dehydrogenase family protein [Longimicrobium terrae]MBB4638822.1 alkylation response protein AidB-like acyl-CoA dehydrogenase [Longimicrobium terrae]MBB6073061.1 alkylation response protein AidB-like acyl-CoA dehydrogenase [Longimicrobium terrae]NNC33184.1 acyl-CoA dehydrogenase [Longimicrobium terrae]